MLRFGMFCLALAALIALPAFFVSADARSTWMLIAVSTAVVGGLFLLGVFLQHVAPAVPPAKVRVSSQRPPSRH
ncbi:MAG: hypothetical protein ACR2GY_08660 [Phycisphaerales bacterium]